jgi:AcrR family transcriptional regulator
MSKVTREEILEAAICLFNQNGYHATSMQDIARAVAIKKPSLYHHFDSKEAILLAILESGVTYLIEDIDAVVRSGLDSASKLRAAVRAHAQLLATHPGAAAIFLREDRGLGEDYMQEYVAKRDRVEHLLRAIIEQGIAAGDFRPTDVPITAHALLGMVNWMTRWYRPEGRLSAAQIADLFTDLFLEGLRRPPDGAA